MAKFKYRWTSAFGTSLICHAVVIGAITGLMILFPPAPTNKGPIEVDLVTMSGGGGGGGGNGGESPKLEEQLPKIKAAAATPTAPPPAVPTEPDPQAENDVHEIAKTPDPDASTSQSTSSSAFASDGSSDSDGGSSSGTGGGTGGGNGTGNGPGDGSGEGPGSGSGSGGGSGSGYGDGNGAGESTGENSGPQVLYKTLPDYPSAARKANVEGVTIVRVTIGVNGTAVNAEVASSSGNSSLDEAAVNCVYNWGFVPAKQNGVPIEVAANVSVTFKLN